MTFDEEAKLMLESCGYREGSRLYGRIFEGVVAEDEDDRVFEFETNRSLKTADAIEEILKSEPFDRYAHALYGALTDEEDGLLLERWGDDFLSERVEKAVLGLKRGEEFNYQQFFRDVMSISERSEEESLVDFDDPVFMEMPKAVRIY